MKRALIITPWYPPSPVANAKRPWLIARVLHRAGWRVDIITCSSPASPEAALSEEEPGIQVERLPNPIDMVRQGLSRTVPRPIARLVGSLLERHVLWPDEFRSWIRDVARRVPSPSDWDVVFTCIHPPSSFLLHARLGFHPRALLLDYQESVWPQYRAYPRRSPLHRLRRPSLESAERLCLQQCRHALFTSRQALEQYVTQGLLPASKAFLLPHFYEETLLPPDGPPPREFTILYAGTFGRRVRSPEVFLCALAGFLRLHPEARSITRFDFYGDWLPVHSRRMSALRLQDVVRLHPPVSLVEYFRLLRTASVLLLVVDPAHASFMPGKLTDYFAARRPILAFLPADTEVGMLLRNAGCGPTCVEPRDAEGGCHVLARVWGEFQRGGTGFRPAPPPDLSLAMQGRRLLDLLEDITRK